jgi:hypothetical protein
MKAGDYLPKRHRKKNDSWKDEKVGDEVYMKETLCSILDIKEESEQDMPQYMDLKEIVVEFLALWEVHGD